MVTPRRPEHAQAAGSVKVKVLPRPGVLSAVRSPPIPRARSRLIADLSPVPPPVRVRPVAAGCRVQGTATRDRTSGVPAPGVLTGMAGAAAGRPGNAPRERTRSAARAADPYQPAAFDDQFGRAAWWRTGRIGRGRYNEVSKSAGRAVRDGGAPLGRLPAARSLARPGTRPSARPGATPAVRHRGRYRGEPAGDAVEDKNSSECSYGLTS